MVCNDWQAALPVISIALKKDNTEENWEERSNADISVVFGVIGTVVAISLVVQFNKKKVQATDDYALIWAQFGSQYDSLMPHTVNKNKTNTWNKEAASL